jgi:hypothetical protein
LRTRYFLLSFKLTIDNGNTTNHGTPITAISVCPTCPAVTVTATEQLITSCGDTTPTPTTTVCTTGGVYNLGGNGNFVIVKDADCPTTISYNAPCQTCYVCPYGQCYDSHSKLVAVKNVIIYEYQGSQQVGCTYEDWYCQEIEQYYTHSTYIPSPTIFIYNDITINVTLAPTYLTYTETATVTATSTKTVSVLPTGSDNPISRGPSGQLSSAAPSASPSAAPSGGVALKFYLDAEQGLPIIQRDGKLAYDSSATSPITVYLRGDELYDANGNVLYINLTDLASNAQSIIYFALDSTQVPSDGATHIFSLLNGLTLQVTVNGETLVELTCSDDGFIHFGRAGTRGCQAGTLVTTPVFPSSSASAAPSSEPQSVTPSINPASNGPSSIPSVAPSAAPSSAPSVAPSFAPSSIPSIAPSGPAASSGSPSVAPSDSPSGIPSDLPSLPPSVAPSDVPSSAPSVAPSAAPSAPASPNTLHVAVDNEEIEACAPDNPSPTRKLMRRSLPRAAKVTATLLDPTAAPVPGVLITLHGGVSGEAYFDGIQDSMDGSYTGVTDSNGQVIVTLNCPDATVSFDFTATADILGFAVLNSDNSVPVQIIAGAVNCDDSYFSPYSSDGNTVTQGDEVDFTIDLADYYGNTITIDTYPVCINVSPAINSNTQYCLSTGTSAYFSFTQSTYAGDMTFTADVCSGTFTKTYTWAPPPISCGSVVYSQGFVSNTYRDLVDLVVTLSNGATPVTGAAITVTSKFNVFWPPGTQDVNAGPSLKTITLIDNSDGTYSYPPGYDVSYVYNNLDGNSPNRKDPLTVVITHPSINCNVVKNVNWYQPS